MLPILDARCRLKQIVNESASNRPATVRTRGGSHFGDRAFKWLTLLMALSVFALIVLIGYELAQRLAARAAQIRLAFPRQQRLGPGQRTIRRGAVHLRHAGFIRHRAAHRRAHQHRHRRLSHRTRAALAAPAVDHVHRTARRRAERHSRSVGNFCDGAVAARPFVSVAAKARSVFCRCFKGRFTASACWPAASSSPS